MIYRVIPCFLHVPEDSGASAIESVKALARDCGAIVMTDSSSCDRESDFIVKTRESFDRLPEFAH